MSEDTQFAVAVRRGANLPEEKWTEERITAIVRTLPSQFQNRGDAIVFVGLAHRYNLDPFAGEIYAWPNKRTGKMQTYVSRDGLTKKVRESPRLRDIDAQLVYAGDEVEFEKDPTTGKVLVRHVSRPFADGSDLVGGYCVIRGEGDLPDTLVTRRLSDYSHLFSKDNWATNKQDMLLARVISAAARLRIDLGGVYLPEDFELEERPPDDPGGNGKKSVSDRLAAMRKAGAVPDADDEEVPDADYEIMEHGAEEALGAPDDTTPELPDGYRAELKSNGWYTLFSTRSGEPVDDKSYREADLEERALADIEEASTVRQDIDAIVTTHDESADWHEVAHLVAADMGLPETDPMRLGGSTLRTIRGIIEERISIGTL